MKLIYDVIGASPGSGGPELHARELLMAWTAEYPSDELIVVGTRWAGLPKDFAPGVRWMTWPNRNLVWRIVGQILVVPLVARIFRSHALLVSLSVLSPLAPKNRSFVFAHDWRHLLRPTEFSLPRRAYRAIWRRSVNRAAITFCISRKTLEETASIAPDANLVLAENGHDHALRWALNTDSLNSPTLRALSGGEAVVVTFGHRNNKRPELVMSALATLASAQRPHLVVLGAGQSDQEALEVLAKTQGISQSVLLPGYVSDPEYQAIMKRATCVVLASTDEGFGLPVAEALSLGHAVVVTSDSGLADTFGAAVIAVLPEPAALGRGISEALTRASASAQLSQSPAPSWADTVRVVREAMCTAMVQFSAEPKRTG